MIFPMLVLKVWVMRHQTYIKRMVCFGLYKNQKMRSLMYIAQNELLKSDIS